MTERPILFNGDMVRALLDGRKTQTRLFVKNADNLEVHPSDKNWFFMHHKDCGGGCDFDCGTFESPYGKVGDRLWVRETFRLGNRYNELSPSDSPSCTPVWFKAGGVEYNGDSGFLHVEGRWRSSIHMPRWASRITLEITGVRVERVQDIKLKDIAAEGVRGDTYLGAEWRGKWIHLWDSINGKDKAKCWGANPLVWVVEFEVVK
jgi:hypothetical protein